MQSVMKSDNPALPDHRTVVTPISRYICERVTGIDPQEVVRSTFSRKIDRERIMSIQPCSSLAPHAQSCIDRKNKTEIDMPQLVRCIRCAEPELKALATRR